MRFVFMEPPDIRSCSLAAPMQGVCTASNKGPRRLAGSVPMLTNY
jgi:hypothetical protein